MFKKIIAVLFSLLFSVICFGYGCGTQTVESDKMESEEVYSYYFDKFGDEVMPIGGYIGPTVGFGYKGVYMDSQIDNYHFALIKDCGLNFIAGMKPDYKTHPDDVLSCLYYADKNDVMYFVQDTFLYSISPKNGQDSSKYMHVSKDVFKERLKEYSEYGSFAGLILFDEPFAVEFPQLTAIDEVFNEVIENDNKCLYVNSNSYQCPNTWFGGGNPAADGYIEYKTEMRLEEYMEEYFKAMPNLKFYSYDFYPFTDSEGTIKPLTFENYYLAGKYAERNGLPFWSFMQSSGESGFRKPNEGEMLWQVNTALAFGAKGLQYYTYNTPPELIYEEEGRVGLVGRAGEKTEMFYYAQNANNQVSACDHILMKSKFKGVIQHLSGENDATNSVSMPKDISLTDFNCVKSISGDNSVTGCFNYQGKTVLYVVNNSIEKDKANVVVNFDKNYKYDVIQRGKTFTLSGKKLELKFAPGEGACIVLY